LGRALSGDPDLLLLDEPTNHLDVDSLEWLERELQSLDAAIVLVAHDRWFLEAVTTSVLELEGGRSIFFRGPWHEWRREKAARARSTCSRTSRSRSSAASTSRSSGRTAQGRRRCWRSCCAGRSATASCRPTSRSRSSSSTSVARCSTAR